MGKAFGMPVVVCSHQSSGTNLLLASIWKNFRLPDTSREVYVKTPSKRVFLVEGKPVPYTYSKKYDSKNVVVSPWAAMFGTHRPVERLPFICALRGVTLDKVLYIVRHPVDTLVSFWKRKDPRNEFGWEARINEESVSYWYEHASGYIGHCGDWVKYESLVEAPQLVLLGIEYRFGLKRKKDSFALVDGRVGWVKQPGDDGRGQG